ncbi:B12-binding domain-containing radical SAM protein [Actinacidiphila bryophytorum]|uniref:B12-binding domain-containing radical SAM protein n=1 Tax=Actinacidiphila bryophytorum TaxID=1436133 RepID=UPI002176B353|nr:radical SAM protein [Actinacidiphila bryophytorum]UWE10851.1 radical SAM protein [Actinacidiphila bryophytorum]
MQEQRNIADPTVHAAGQLLVEAVRHAADLNMIRADEALLLDPQRLQQFLETATAGRVGRVRVAGTLDRRLVCIERQDGQWTLADLSGHPHRTRTWPGWATGRIDVEDADSWLSSARLDDQAVYRLSRPVVLLAALYHPENFPLPRFPLGISDVARAARTTLMGTVSMADMQLGLTLPDLVQLVAQQQPDILGVSATFGQHDLMTELLDAAYAMLPPPLVIAGGSLTARNESLLLDRYPALLIARGGGELTVQDLLAHWHGDMPLHDVHGIGYNGASRGEGTLTIGHRRRTPKPVSREHGDFLPELDLLPSTFEHHGVAQLEASRGCTNFCSFCPRGHKGQWAGGTPDDFRWMLNEMGAVFDRYPEISRTLYLVDEEFIGRGPDAVPRALEMADLLHGARFQWETSCRIDQVTHPDKGFAWHAERAGMWRGLLERGLRRCLFGVESGVDSILRRFNKETVGEQNALAIRTLSALGVPTRYTYIAFDHLMTLQELEATYAYQGRTDLLLRPLPGVPVEEIVNGVRDPEWVQAHAAGRAFHTGISYMLVSMECLIGAAYTKQVQKAGLAGEVRPSMGRQDARFADWRIGVCSRWAQLWVDRNFALDYTLKSLEKILDGQPRHRVRGARVVLKDAAYTVLGGMIAAAEQAPADPVPGQDLVLEQRIRTLLDEEFGVLGDRMAKAVTDVAGVLPADSARVLASEHLRWSQTRQWRSINASDPCGT